jgi:asparagine synthase (glutamine-hydrolysing)
LTLLRDRLGVKPLYYSWAGRTLCFASELKGLRAFTHWDTELDREALGEYFQYGYISGDRSIYAGVRKLMPGHALELAPDQPPRVYAYWRAMDYQGRHHDLDEQQSEQRLEALLIDAFRLRLVSDVPVGVFLSGGVDSSLVAALLRRHSGRDIRTFTVGFRDGAFNEARWAQKVAVHLDTRHTEVTLEPDEAKSILPMWADLYDEPFGDASGIPTHLIARTARQSVKVALSADGGDELFSGYEHYGLILDRVRRAGSIPAPLRALVAGGLTTAARPLAAASAHMPARIRHLGRRMILERVPKLAGMIDRPDGALVHELAMSSWSRGQVEPLIGEQRNPRDSLTRYPGDLAEQMSLSDINDYLPADVLTKVDRATMAVGLEGREPLLDHRIVEFALGLPTTYKRGALGSKHLLKRILYRYVPRDLTDRPKQGFAVPLSRWLRNDFRNLVHDYLSAERIRRQGLLSSVVVQSAVDNFYEGGPNGDRIDTQKLWLLLAFSMWSERWAERPTVAMAS